MTDHFSYTPKRNAEFIKPPNTLKAKVGHGGLSDDILNAAQEMLDQNTLEFEPWALEYLEALGKAIEIAKGNLKPDETEHNIALMIYPVMQLKAHGGMFRYPLISKISDRLIALLEVLGEPDIESLEIILAFHTAIKAIIRDKITGDGGMIGSALLDALTQACQHYLDRYQGQKS